VTGIRLLCFADRTRGRPDINRPASPRTGVGITARCPRTRPRRPRCTRAAAGIAGTRRWRAPCSPRGSRRSVLKMLGTSGDMARSLKSKSSLPSIGPVLGFHKARGGDRAKKLFQFLNEIGARALRMHLGRVLEMAESSPDKTEYERAVRSGTTARLADTGASAACTTSGGRQLRLAPLDHAQMNG